VLKKNQAICWMVLVGVVLLGCRGKSEPERPSELGARMVGLKVGEVAHNHSTVEFQVEIANTYASDLPIVNLRYRLASNGNEFVTVLDVVRVAVGPNQKQVVTLQDRVYYRRLFDALGADSGEKIDYECELRLQARGPEGQVIELTADGSGVLVLPEKPQSTAKEGRPEFIDVAFVVTPPEVVAKMLEMAEVGKDDLLCDLGCGDGRIPVTAAMQYGCRTFGYDLHPARVKEALANAEKNNVAHLVHIEQKDIFTVDLSEMDVVTMYLLPDLNMRLMPQLEELKAGSRVVSHDFAISGVEPDETAKVKCKQDNREHTVFLWIAPLKGNTARSLD